MIEKKDKRYEKLLLLLLFYRKIVVMQNCCNAILTDRIDELEKVCINK